MAATGAESAVYDCLVYLLEILDSWRLAADYSGLHDGRLATETPLKRSTVFLVAM